MQRIVGVVLYCLAVMTGSAVALDVGVGVADITPDVEAYRVPLAGYGARLGKPSTGVHDPLHAKVLYFRDGDTKMGLIACDLRSITPEFKNQIVRKTARHGFTPDNLFVSASHTHAGPAMYPEKFWQLQFGVYDPKIVETMSTAVAEAVTDAVRNAAPARVGFGKGGAEGFARNRRLGYDTESRQAAGEKPAVASEVWVMRVDSMQGAPRALLVNFAAHPTILGADNMLITAEWPGVLQREVQKAFPGAVALYTNGAMGDQAPGGAQGADGFEKADDFGTRLAAIVSQIARGIETHESVPIGFSRTTPALPDIVFSENARKRYGKRFESALEALPRTAEIHVLQVGTAAVVGLPGEPILEVGRAAKQGVGALGFEQVVVVGLASDYIGYIVNEKEYAHGGYEVDARSYYGPGLGAFIAANAAKTAEPLRGEQRR